MRKELIANISKAALVLSAVAVCCLAPRAARAQATDPFIGEIITVPYTFCPYGWVEPLGQTLSIGQNSALFSLIGTNFGGNGTTTFQLPYLPPQVLSYAGNPSYGFGVPYQQFQLKHCMSMAGAFPSRN
jgi:microcystin-dependent protein